MHIKAGEILVLETYTFPGEGQVNGPFRSTRDFDMQDVLAEYMETLGPVASEEELEVRGKADAYHASFRHHRVDHDYPSTACIAWMVSKGLLEEQPAKVLRVLVMYQDKVARGRVTSSERNGGEEVQIDAPPAPIPGR